jgi:hypothetical protein
MPSYHPPHGYGSPRETQAPAVAEPVVTTSYERYHAQMDEATNDVTGLGFLGCLVLRNVSRTVKIALGAAGSSSSADLAGGAKSIFDEFAAAADNGATRDEALVKIDKVDYSAARKGADALVSLERTLVAITMEDHALGKFLGEILAVCLEARGKAA